MSTFCGFDFGTSNSTLGTINNQQPVLAHIPPHGSVVRSAIFFDAEKKHYVFGQEGVRQYMGGCTGRLLMSLKSVLGSSLMHEKTMINQQRISFADILGFFIRYMKTQAEASIQEQLTHVVMGRPVRFHDQDDKIDAQAQKTLEDIAKAQGFEEVQFQYEPIAAALAYESELKKEKLALIIDLGGGTSDFTIIRLSPTRHQEMDRQSDVLANHGIHIGGTDFDRLLSLKEVMPYFGLNTLMRGTTGLIDLPSSYFHSLTTWHTINDLYKPKVVAELKLLLASCVEKDKFQRLIRLIEQRQGHQLLNDVEQVKVNLSRVKETEMALAYIEQALTILLSRDGFESAIAQFVESLQTTIVQTLDQAGVQSKAIDSVFFTGGSTQIPCIYQMITDLFPQSEMIRGDVYGSVGYGLTLDAMRRFGRAA